MPSRSSLILALRSPLLPLWLLVALLPFGRSAELSTALCIGLCGWWLWRKPVVLRTPGVTLWLVLIACYVAAALLSSFGALMPGKSWSTTAGLLRYVPIGVYACSVLRTRGQWAALQDGIALVLALWVLDAWMQMLTGWSLRGHAEAERITGLFGATDPKLGPSLSVLSPFLLLSVRWRFGRVALAVAMLVLLGPVLLSGSRAAWICYALVVLAFLRREAGSWRSFIGLGAATALVLAAAGLLAWHTSSRFDARMQRTFGLFGGTAQSFNQATAGRLDIWHNSWLIVQRYPWTGAGVRGFRYAYAQVAPASDHFMQAENCGDGVGACHAHQLLLELLTETGTLGLLIWCVAVVLGVRAWRRISAGARDAAFAASVALAVMLFPFNTHLAFYSAWWGLLFAWLLALWCAALRVTETADAA